MLPSIVMTDWPGPVTVTDSVMFGRFDVSRIVPLSDGWNVIVSAPPRALACVMAHRSVPLEPSSESDVTTSSVTSVTASV